MGGCALDDHLKLDQRYSADPDPAYDIHDLMHVMNFASGGLHLLSFSLTNITEGIGPSSTSGA